MITRIILIRLSLISCKQKVLSQPCQNLIVKSSNNVFLLGDSIVANSAFSNQVNTSCATGKEGCILEKLTTDYYSSLSKESGSVLKLDKTHQLSLKIYKKKSSTEEHIRAYAFPLLLTSFLKRFVFKSILYIFTLLASALSSS